MVFAVLLSHLKFTYIHYVLLSLFSRIKVLHLYSLINFCYNNNFHDICSILYFINITDTQIIVFMRYKQYSLHE